MKTQFPKYTNDSKIRKSFDKSAKLQDFLKYYPKSDGTRRYYRLRLLEFFLERQIINADEYLKDPRLMANKKRVQYLDRLEDDIRKHFNYINTERDPPLHRSDVFLAAVKGLLTYHKIDLPEITWKNLRKNGNSEYRLSKFKTPTREQLRLILSHADVEAKAFFLVQMTSGSIISEIISLKMQDIDLDCEFPRIFIRNFNSKTGRPIRKRISPEAKEALIDYLSIRKEIIETRRNRTISIKHKIPEDDDRLFPMGRANDEKMWMTITRKAGLYKLDPQTNKPIMGTHSLRRYFKTRFGNHDPYLAKYFMGQSTKVDESYDDWSDEQLDEHYSEGVKHLFINQTPLETDNKIKQLSKELDKTNDSLKNKADYIKFLGERQKSDNQRLERLEKLLTRLKYDRIDPFAGPVLTQEENDFEDRLEDKIMREKEQRLKKLLETDPEYKDREIVYLDRTYNHDGTIRNYGAPFFKKKEKHKKEESDLFEELGLVMKENQVINTLIEMDDEKIQDIIEKVKDMKQGNYISFKEARKKYNQTENH
jgi:hypothetical protein